MEGQLAEMELVAVIPAAIITAIARFGHIPLVIFALYQSAARVRAGWPASGPASFGVRYEYYFPSVPYILAKASW